MKMCKEGMENLIIAIMRQAVIDHKNGSYSEIEEIENFFLSEWCERLLSHMDITKDVFYLRVAR